MTEQQPDQELFEEIRREHEGLRNLLAGLHKVLGDRLEQVEEVSRRMESLSARIETHFNQEELTGFFDRIVDRAPRLSEQIDDLRAEHQSMLSDVRALHEISVDGDGSPAWWQRLEDKFHQFSKELMQHEHKENQLLQQAYDEDIGAAD